MEWTEWQGGDCPLPDDARVRVGMRHLLYPQDRIGAEMRGTYRAGDIQGWKHAGNAGDIIAYRTA